MITLPQRQTLLSLIQQACQAGARLHKACAVVGLAARTVQRWLQPAAVAGERRTSQQRTPHVPANKFTDAQGQAAMHTLSSNAFKDLPPSQIVPRLADLGRYVGSESTLYRLLHQAGQLAHRRLERVPYKRSKPRALVATAPDQIYCWDITYLPTEVRGQHFYLYLFADLFSRKAVGWQVFDCESAELSSQLLQDICRRAGIKPDQLTVHSDNGGPMKAQTMLTTMQDLGVAHSRSRPAVSNDNPYAESLFKTLKYRPQLPVKPFKDLLEARRWVEQLLHWYNDEHRHSAISFVTPAQRHAGLDAGLLNVRKSVYETARQANPNRWSKDTRSWHYKCAVHLNPDSAESKEPNTALKAA